MIRISGESVANAFSGAANEFRMAAESLLFTLRHLLMFACLLFAALCVRWWLAPALALMTLLRDMRSFEKYLKMVRGRELSPAQLSNIRYILKTRLKDFPSNRRYKILMRAVTQALDTNRDCLAR